MSDEKKFEAFKRRAVERNEELHGREVREKYGDVQMDEANAAVMGLTQERYREWTELGREIQGRLEAAVRAGISRRERKAGRSPPSTAGGSPSPAAPMIRRSTGGSRSSTRRTSGLPPTMIKPFPDAPASCGTPYAAGRSDREKRVPKRREARGRLPRASRFRCVKGNGAIRYAPSAGSRRGGGRGCPPASPRRALWW